MELTYRGIRYQPKSPFMKTVESGMRAKFLGKDYQIKQYYLDSLEMKPQLGLRRYRGLAYGG
ncbi:MAG: DUF4278 domain-containing protein [Cyanobacteria bacterium J083]|nr:MAG: DUF4278 domain-containing protein [Cyanobacteria bacterium J083]